MFGQKSAGWGSNRVNKDAPLLRNVEGGQPHALATKPTLLDRAANPKTAARSENTRLAYEPDWKHFCAWCQAQSRPPLPAEPVTVNMYLADDAENLKPSVVFPSCRAEALVATVLFQGKTQTRNR